MKPDSDIATPIPERSQCADVQQSLHDDNDAARFHAAPAVAIPDEYNPFDYNVIVGGGS